MIFCYIRRVELTENLDLLLNIFNLVLCGFKIYDFDRDNLL